MSFAEQIRSLTLEADTTNSHNKSESPEEFEARIARIRDEKYTFLTDKYFEIIMRGITNAAKSGKSARYINFDRNDFKANCKGLGYPNQFQKAWLEELQKPDSKYLTRFNTTEVKISLEGITFDIWNNKAFTTVFKW
tara:strand:- start:166 stop:576 length:411 start_codon:yes stop_codon:yes gene_type:complete